MLAVPQAAEGMVVDGAVGPETAAALGVSVVGGGVNTGWLPPAALTRY